MDGMDLTPDPPDTSDLTPEVIELLASAEVDGGFDAAAVDLGRDPVAVRRALDATDFSTQVTRFRRLRTELAGPAAPPLSDLERRRLKNAARETPLGPAADAPPHRTRPWSRVVSVAAAAVVVVVVGAGVFAAVYNDRTGSTFSKAGQALDNSARAEAGAEAKDSTAVTDLGDLGDVSDPATLRAALETTTATVPEAPGGAAEQLPCLGTFTASAGDPGVLRAHGTGTDDGVPVVILVFEDNGRTAAWVLDATDCHVRASQSS